MIKKALILFILTLTFYCAATVPTSINSITFDGNGTATAFPCPFVTPSAEDVFCTKINSTGETTQLILNSDFSVSGVNESAGFTVTYPISGDPLATGATLEVKRIVPITQNTLLPIYEKYHPTVIESALDYLTLICQQLNNDLGHSLGFPLSDPSGLNYTLPSVTERFDKFISFDEAGNLILEGATKDANAVSLQGIPVDLNGVVDNDVLTYVNNVIVPRGISGSGTVKSVNKVFPLPKTDGDIVLNSDHVPAGTHNLYFTDQTLSSSGSFVTLKNEVDNNDNDIATLKTEWHTVDELSITNQTDIATNTTALTKTLKADPALTIGMIPKAEANNHLGDGYHIGTAKNDLVITDTTGKFPSSVIPHIKITETKAFFHDETTTYETCPTDFAASWKDAENGSMATIIWYETPTEGDTPVEVSTIWICTNETKIGTIDAWTEYGLEIGAVKVNGHVGHTINLHTGDIAEGKGLGDTSNLWYTDGKVTASTAVKANTALSKSNKTNTTKNTTDITTLEKLTTGMLHGTEKFSSININGSVIDGVSGDVKTKDSETLPTTIVTNTIYTYTVTNKTNTAKNVTAIGTKADKTYVDDTFVTKGTEQADITGNVTVKANKAGVNENKNNILTNFNKYLKGLRSNGTLDIIKNCNIQFSAGMFYCYIATLNIPISQNGLLVVASSSTGRDGDTKIQIYYASAGDVFIRTNVSSTTWTSWIKVNTIGFEVGDYKITIRSSELIKPTELPCNMGLLELDVKTYPELAEVYDVESGTFNAALTLGDFIRNVGGNAVGLNSHQEDAFQGHHHSINGILAKVSLDDRSSLFTGNTGNLPNIAIDPITDGVNGIPRTDNETRPVNTTLNFFQIASTTYNYKAFAQYQNTDPITVYGWDKENNVLNYQTKSPVNFIESTVSELHYWHEKSSSVTADKPLSLQADFVLETNQKYVDVWKNETWSRVEDHRGETVYSLTTGQSYIVDYLGIIKTGFTIIVPPALVQYYKFSDGKWILDDSRKPELISILSSNFKQDAQKKITDALWTDLIANSATPTKDYEETRLREIQSTNTQINALQTKNMNNLIKLLSK